MRRTCGCGCGRKFEAKTERRRFYEASCRVRASRGGGAVVDITTAKPASAAASESTPAVAELTGVHGATFKELEKAERIGTAYGQAALVLAKRIDAGRDTGSAMATMTRQLRETLAEALKGARREGSKLDELTEKRRQRLHRGA